ncbi:hypothetical protein BKA82DRAFT_4347971 [Pisolithus tinctorius]|nr:hypothetical protein BKA82DRAFT_4347971 [Pisolithus tinctorius]
MIQPHLHHFLLCLLTNLSSLEKHLIQKALLADKVLPPAHTLLSEKVHVSEVLAQSQKSTLAPEFIVASKTPDMQFGSPYLKKAPSQVHSESTSTPSTSSDEEEVVSSDNDLTSSIQSELKVPKPPGEPGHLGRGGYTLETALNWS